MNRSKAVCHTLRQKFLILDQPFSETLSREVFENLLKETTAESVDSSANPGTKEDIQKTEELSNVSSVQTTVSSKRKFKCESCNHKSTSKYLLVLHTYLEHKGFLYLCPVDPKNCTNSFRMKPGIKYHVEKVHTECTDDYSKGLYLDCVVKRMQVSSEGKKKQICNRYVIQKNELGSPKLIKYNPKEGSDSSSVYTENSEQTTETSEEESGKPPAKKCRPSKSEGPTKGKQIKKDISPKAKAMKTGQSRKGNTQPEVSENSKRST